jgi:cytochrome c5
MPGSASSLPRPGGVAHGLQPQRAQAVGTGSIDPNVTRHEEIHMQAFAIPGSLVLVFGIAAAPAALAADGKAVYDKTCVACHASGVANAPKLGDKAAWAPRIATGKDALFTSVVKGKGAMPPKAGAADLKDEDIKAAIDYMTAAVK